MKLLILRGSSQNVNPLSYNVQEIGLAKVLVHKGWSVRIISSSDNDIPRTITPVDGVEWIECKRVGFSRNLGWPLGALNKIHEFHPDIIQVQDILTPSTILAVKAKTEEGVPLVLSMGEYPDGRMTRTAARKALATFMRHKYSAVLCKTKTSARYSKKLGLSGVNLCPVGIDPDIYTPAEERQYMDWMESIKFKRKQGKHILCHVGRIDKRDNIPFLMQVLANLPTNYEFLVAGEPYDFGQKVAHQIGVSERVMFVGSVPNCMIGAVFENSLAMLSCSKVEPFGLAAVESLYHGCPVFAHPTGGLLDIIIDGYNGLHISERSPKTWAKVIRDTVEGDKLMRLRLNTTKGSEQLTWSYRALAYEKVYMNVLEMHK